MEFFCTAKCDKIKKKLMFSFWLILRQSSKLSEEGATETNIVELRAIRSARSFFACVQIENNRKCKQNDTIIGIYCNH